MPIRPLGLSGRQDADKNRMQKEKGDWDVAEFERVSPESVGIDSGCIERFLKLEKEAGVELHSFMIVRDGKVAAEGWAAPYQRDLPHTMFSFSKTLTAVACFLAAQEGILSLDEKLIDLFPEYCPASVSDNLAQADIRSLLTMSCGHKTEMSDAEVSSYGGNWIRAFLAHPFSFAPGTLFTYNTWGTDLVSAIIQKKTGLKLTEFLTPRLFEPLGIEGAYCSSKHLGDAFTTSVEGGGWGMHLTTDQMARFIWMLEQDGIWEGRRILDHTWIEQMSKKQIETDNPYYNDGHIRSNWLQGYGFQNWQCAEAGVWRADGAFGQFGLVIPRKNAIVLMTACALDTEAQLNIAYETLIAGMQGDSPRQTSADPVVLPGQVAAGPAPASALGAAASPYAPAASDAPSASEAESSGAGFGLVVPSTRASRPLPENEAAWSSLKTAAAGWRLPVLWGLRAPGLQDAFGHVRFAADSDCAPSLEEFIGGPGYFEKDGLSIKAVTFRFEGNTAYLDFDLNQKPEGQTTDFCFDPFSPAGRLRPSDRDKLICRDDDPSKAVRQTLAVGMDGKNRFSKLTACTIAASGAFTSPSTFDLYVRNIETVEGVRIRATFFRDMLNLEAVGNIPELNTLTQRDVQSIHFSAQER